MPDNPNLISELKFHPLIPERWKDIESLFGERGACGGCWCMWWKLNKRQFEDQKGQANKTAFKAIIDANEIPGIIAYSDEIPVGWCAIEPRSAYPRLKNSRILKPVDDNPVWSITCFFIAKPFRRQGISVELLKAAVNHAKINGAKIVEGYPVEPNKDMPDAFVYHGLSNAFLKAGFKEVTRRSETRPIMRFCLE